MRHRTIDFLMSQSNIPYDVTMDKEEPLPNGGVGSAPPEVGVGGTNNSARTIIPLLTLPSQTELSGGFQGSTTASPAEEICPRLCCRSRYIQMHRMYVLMSEACKLANKSDEKTKELEQQILEEKLANERLRAEWNAHTAAEVSTENVVINQELRELCRKLESEVQILKNDNIEMKQRLKTDTDKKNEARQTWENRQTDILKVFNNRQQRIEEKFKYWEQVMPKESIKMKRLQTSVQELVDTMSEELEDVAVKTEKTVKKMEALEVNVTDLEVELQKLKGHVTVKLEKTEKKVVARLGQAGEKMDSIVAQFTSLNESVSKDIQKANLEAQLLERKVHDLSQKREDKPRKVEQDEVLLQIMNALQNEIKTQLSTLRQDKLLTNYYPPQGVNVRFEVQEEIMNDKKPPNLAPCIEVNTWRTPGTGSDIPVTESSKIFPVSAVFSPTQGTRYVEKSINKKRQLEVGAAGGSQDIESRNENLGLQGKKKWKLTSTRERKKSLKKPRLNRRIENFPQNATEEAVMNPGSGEPVPGNLIVSPTTPPPSFDMSEIFSVVISQ